MKKSENDTTEKVLEFIKQYKASHGGNSPSYRDICDGVSIASTSVVSYHIRRLIEEGKINRLEGGSRSFVILEREEE